MHSTEVTKQTFFAAVADGILIDEYGRERSVDQVTRVFSKAPLVDVAEWIAEHKAHTRGEAQ